MTREQNIIRTEGIILNSFRLRDADRMVVILTSGYGKLKVVMKAAARGRNRFAASAEIGTLVRGRFFFKTPHAEAGRVIELVIVNSFVALRQSIERIMVLSYVLNVVEEACPWHDPHPGFFGLFRSVLERLDAEETPGRVGALLRVFELKLLFFLGIHPDLGHCGHCGGKSTGTAVLDVRTMNSLCSDCLSRTPGSGNGRMLELGRGFVRFYNETQTLPDGGGPPELSGQTDKQARAFFKAVFLNYLGKKLKVLEVRGDLS